MSIEREVLSTLVDRVDIYLSVIRGYTEPSPEDLPNLESALRTAREVLRTSAPFGIPR